MGFSRQEYWSRLPFLTSGALPNPEIEPMSLVSLALAGRFFTTVPPGKPSIRIHQLIWRLFILWNATQQHLMVWPGPRRPWYPFRKSTRSDYFQNNSKTLFTFSSLLTFVLIFICHWWWASNGWLKFEWLNINWGSNISLYLLLFVFFIKKIFLFACAGSSLQHMGSSIFTVGCRF